MSFADIQDAHRQLRLRVRVHVGEAAFPEATIAVPRRDDDELSFLRLVIWGYVLLQENGRVVLRFLAELPPFTTRELLPEVMYLRTWTTHNLQPDRTSDKKKLQLAWSWLKTSCGTSNPETPAQWRGCFDRLSDGLLRLLRDALAACEALDGPDDGPRLLEELRRRVDRDWEAYRFDQTVVDAGKRLGFDGIDPVPFRTRHLASWRKVVAAAEDRAIQRLLAQRVEKDLLDLMSDALPVTAHEVLERVDLEDPREVAALMLVVRAKARCSREGLHLLLEGVAAEIRSKGIGP